MRPLLPLAGLVVSLASTAVAQQDAATLRADTLRGSITPERAWWDVAFYDLQVADPVRPTAPSAGSTASPTGCCSRAREMQIDLQEPLAGRQHGAGRAARSHTGATATRSSSSWRAPQARGSTGTLTRLLPRPSAGGAKRPPWDGGFIWTQRTAWARPWIATACQGTGASIWWPNKDTQADEPDSQRVAITVPDPIINVSNGRLRATTPNGDGTTTYEWFVTAADQQLRHRGQRRPATPTSSDTYDGEERPAHPRLLAARLPPRRRAAAVRPGQADARPASSSWFGPYPWYEDGYKLVETPHLGMEHQSARRLRQPLPQRLPRPRPLRHRAGAGLGLHHRARERPRVVGQQPHHRRPGRHVGARELRELRRGAVHRVPARRRRPGRST